MDTFERGRYLIILENKKKFHSHRLLPLQQHIQPCTIFFSKKDLNRAKNQICQIPTLGRKKYRCKSSQLFLKSFLKNKKKGRRLIFFISLVEAISSRFDARLIVADREIEITCPLVVGNRGTWTQLLYFIAFPARVRLLHARPVLQSDFNASLIISDLWLEECPSLCSTWAGQTVAAVTYVWANLVSNLISKYRFLPRLDRSRVQRFLVVYREGVTVFHGLEFGRRG